MKATHSAKLYFDPTTWLVWVNTQFPTVRLLLSFFGLLMCTVHSDKPILTIYTSWYDVFPWKDVPFGGSIDIPPHLGVRSPKTKLWGVNMHFQAKCAKYPNLHINESTAWIPTKFCIPILPKYASRVARNAVNKSKMADSCHLETLKSHDISATISPILMKFCKVMHLGPPDPISFKSSRI